MKKHPVSKKNLLTLASVLGDFPLLESGDKVRKELQPLCPNYISFSGKTRRKSEGKIFLKKIRIEVETEMEHNLHLTIPVLFRV